MLCFASSTFMVSLNLQFIYSGHKADALRKKKYELVRLKCKQKPFMTHFTY